MRHPFELQLSELETINFAIQELTDEFSEQVAGGGEVNTLALEENGDKPPIVSLALEENGDKPPTSEPYGIMEGGCVIKV